MSVGPGATRAGLFRSASREFRNARRTLSQLRQTLPDRIPATICLHGAVLNPNTIRFLSGCNNRARERQTILDCRRATAGHRPSLRAVAGRDIARVSDPRGPESNRASEIGEPGRIGSIAPTADLLPGESHRFLHVRTAREDSRVVTMQTRGKSHARRLMPSEQSSHPMLGEGTNIPYMNRTV